MSDTLPTGADQLVKDMYADRRNMLIERNEIIAFDRLARNFDLSMKLAVTPTFFNHFFPYGEDAIKGVDFETVLWDILKVFKKESQGMVRQGMTFPVVSKTYVKRAYGPDKIETFTDGKARDKRTEVQCFLLPDENNHPSLLLSIADYKWI